ncbi:class I SAM-dependent methyltransferase [Pontibacter sp. JH31]|uniref:Class I SAM-dependent methyltransferase n=1 Tax=Pontibacter aquaedesilientis TaxID=2766980 RepID=A0ABR7XH02_9BACT|nr:class I SAM-dependent methyltransferase [Pontibacter aquaedesilientis]MBD1397575.1 class I SAM-dependent methyltransferase [Pontibacter aquaedesilientis]
MLPFHLAANYLLYRLRAFKLHGVHSPFVFDLYNQVILHDGDYYAYPIVEELRQELLQDHRKLLVTDFGAGPKAGLKKERKVSYIARTSAKPAKYAQLIFRLVSHFQPETVFDLGTSLGITTSYLAKANSKATVYTFEGCPSIATEAKANFRKLGIANVRQVIGNLDETLTEQLQKVGQLDFVFFDGNHRYEPTMRYFEACLSKHHEYSVFVLDDLYWSAEMKRAWQDIKKHPKVMQTVDLFYVGLVFFRKSQPKENFTLLY